MNIFFVSWFFAQNVFVSGGFRSVIVLQEKLEDILSPLILQHTGQSS